MSYIKHTAILSIYLAILQQCSHNFHQLSGMQVKLLLTIGEGGHQHRLITSLSSLYPHTLSVELKMVMLQILLTGDGVGNIK